MKTSHLQMFASFRLGTTELAIPISSLQEVVNYPEKITLVPLAPQYLTGLFNLRGVVSPIVDMANLLDVPGDALTENKKVAVVCLEHVRIGLLFDATSEILNVQPSDISWFDETAPGNKSVIRGVLKLNGGDRIIEIIDPMSLVKVENIPQILEQTRDSHVEVARKKSKRSQCITFRSGELEFGLEIASISEIIRVPEIKKSVLAVDYCIGMVNLRGTIIPILDFKKFLKIEDKGGVDADMQRIVILKLEKVHVGFLVDAVDSIVTFYEDDILPIPMFKQEKIEMMKGLLCHNNRSNVLLLKPNKMLSHHEVLEITKGHESLYGKKDATVQETQQRASERKPYLSFKLEYPLSTRLGSVDEIAKMSEDLIRPPGYPEYVLGMLNMRGQVVMVVDLRTFYGMKPMADRQNSRILIVKGQQSKFGLVVDEVESISTLDESKKVKMPSMLTAGAATVLQGDMKDVVEMTDMSGNKKTMMIFEVADFIRKIEAQTTENSVA
ncbi:chemotaxis protein CheW [Bdellovibrio sp. HCB2-146]|uniref:chemotaxis protein CheW n=1 Tax=Bdellovibrio sp. HCB2-146 TaxID=3394362 RepID=UPI0039BC7207